MEILIPGLILVALMVYASTKIKKNAARAYEPEIIEIDAFTVLKPEGFINPLDDSQEYAFLAFSKEYGIEAAENLRQVEARISVFPEYSFDAICERAKQSVIAIISEKTDQIHGSKTCEITAESGRKGVPTNEYLKIAAGWEKIYQLQISVLSEHKDDYLRRIEEMMESFELK